MNLAGNSSPGFAYPGEEYIPPTFRPINLPQWMQTLRSVLFTGTPDRAMYNYRTKELLLPLHATELVSYLAYLDPRFTYIPGSQIKTTLATSPLAVQIAGPPRTIYFGGNLNNLVAHGRIWKEWLVDVVNGTDISIYYLNDTAGTYQTVIVNYTVSNGISSIVNLPGSNINFRFESGIGSKWQISALHRPVISLSEVSVQLGVVLGDNVLNQQLFGPTTKEPYKTFKNLWNMHPFLHYRLGGVILAMIYRTEEMRG